jgi:hypothetical protein
MRYLIKTHWRGGLATLCLGVALVGVGCGSSDETSSLEREAKQQKAREARQAAEQRRRRLREARRIEVRERREAARRRARRVAARERAREEAKALAETEVEESAETESSECDPNYSGACLDPHASDYDCEGGSGNGPDYTGPVAVVGVDHYGLDADGDGYACE